MSSNYLQFICTNLDKSNQYTIVGYLNAQSKMRLIPKIGYYRELYPGV